ncbi:CLOCK-interacting pacemaker a isoform X2 [Fundulus heteroclitus]|uniref:CLOCK-interacting pacemaker a isoform X2 n=1 Tax=Fundulus heteroclitus TaxID=8078 RepID=UPI00165A8B6A|nr:CLOCK-interacting pacemaker a isoform X2 [Fundulus heteroclitus]
MVITVTAKKKKVTNVSFGIGSVEQRLEYKLGYHYNRILVLKKRIADTRMSSFSRPGTLRVPPFTRTPLLKMSKQDLERDSGFSDASSEYLSAVEVTDSEDTGRNGSIIGQEPAGQQVAVVGGSYPGLSPMIIMNNFVLKEPSSMAPQEKQWGFPSSIEVMPQSQVVLLQPVVSNGPSCSPKPGSDNMRQSKSYTPILKSYPRIAPYPVDTPSKSVRPSRVNPSATTGKDHRQMRHHDPQRLDITLSPLSALQTQAQAVSNFEASTNKVQAQLRQEQHSDKSLTAPAESSPSASYAYEDLSPVPDTGDLPAEKYQDLISMHSNKLKRFSNTYNILHKSGLLGITMRTKQLMKENKRTQCQLHLLQEQTALLLEALSSGDPQLWTQLQASLQDTEKEQYEVKAQRVLA